MSTQLVGHEETALCVAITADPIGQIVSGGEGGELRVWSLEGRPIHKLTVAEESDVTSLCCSRRRSDTLFASSGSDIFHFDLRHLSQPVNKFSVSDDEINQMVLNEKEDFLAACDDTGHIKVINLSEKKVFKTLRKHTNICASVAFHPRRPWDLFSGGYDSKLIQWDFSRGRSVCIIDMEEIGIPKVGSEAYLVNPPFVHSVALSGDGHFLACGTEKTQVQIFRANKRNPEFLDTLQGHTQGVSQVHFPDFADRELVTGGNDGQLVFWDLAGIEGDRTMVNGCAHMNGHGGEAQASAAPPPAAAARPALRPRHRIAHGQKVNWLASGKRASRKFVVVADNTSVLTLYPYPL